MLSWLFALVFGLSGLAGTIRVQPGKSINDYQLGSDIRRLQERLGPTRPELITADGELPVQLYVWRSLRPVTELFVYTRGSEVVQLEIFAQDAALPTGIGRRSTLRRIMSQKGLVCYEEMHTASTSTGDRDVLYAVDREEGVAFRLQFHPQSQKPYLTQIIVFPRSGELITRFPLIPCQFSDAGLWNPAWGTPSRSR
jgi:hypothetical protein